MPKRILSLFRNLFRKRAIEQALDDELRSTLEVLIAGEDGARAFAIGGQTRSAYGNWRYRAGEGGGSRSTRWALCGGPRRGHPLWPASVAPQSGLHCRSRPDGIVVFRAKCRLLASCKWQIIKKKTIWRREGFEPSIELLTLYRFSKCLFGSNAAGTACFSVPFCDLTSSQTTSIVSSGTPYRTLRYRYRG